MSSLSAWPGSGDYPQCDLNGGPHAYPLEAPGYTARMAICQFPGLFVESQFKKGGRLPVSRQKLASEMVGANVSFGAKASIMPRYLGPKNSQNIDGTGKSVNDENSGFLHLTGDLMEVIYNLSVS